MLAAVILAAGESRRMGTPKALLPYQHHTFLEHLIEVAQHPKIAPVRIVLGAEAERIQSLLKLDPDSVVINANWAAGQLSSILAAIRSLPSGTTDGLLLLLVDHPLITSKLVATLVERFYATQKPIILPTYKGKRGHPVVFSNRLYEELLAATMDTGARAVVRAHAAEVLEVPTDEEGVVLNLNDPAKLKAAFPEISRG